MMINKCGKFYNIKQSDTETTKQLIERSWFVVNTLHLEDSSKKTQIDFDEANRQSRIWYNMRILECKYSDNESKKIDELEKKAFV